MANMNYYILLHPHTHTRIHNFKPLYAVMVSKLYSLKLQVVRALSTANQCL